VLVEEHRKNAPGRIGLRWKPANIDICYRTM